MDSGKLQLIMLDFWWIKHKGLENFDSSSEIKKEISTKLAKQTSDQRNTNEERLFVLVEWQYKNPSISKDLVKAISNYNAIPCIETNYKYKFSLQKTKLANKTMYAIVKKIYAE